MGEIIRKKSRTRLGKIGKMKSKMLRKIKRVVKNIFFIKKDIAGENNKFEIVAESFRHICVSVHGKENLIHIEDGTFIENCKFFINGNNNRIIIGNLNLFRKTEFRVDGNFCEIKIGKENNFLGEHNVFCVSRSNTQIIVGNQNKFVWGHNNFTAEDGTILKIGSNCLFSNDVYVRTGDSHSLIDLNTDKKINMAKNVEIGNRVWIAPCVRILKGSAIKDDSVVGTGSIVTHSFSKGNVVIAGNPAKIVKENVKWLK